MPTRFYFSPYEDKTSVAPAWASVWEAQIGTPPRATLRTEPYGLGSTNTFTLTKGAATNPYDIAFGQFISEPIGAQTISGTFSMVLPCFESVATNEMYLQVVIRVVSNNGSVVRGTLYAGQTLTSTSATITAANYEFSAAATNTRMLSAVALSSVAAQEGDRIVVEVGARFCTATSGISGTMMTNCKEDAFDDLPLVNDFNDVNNYLRSWIEFSGDLIGSSLAVEEYRFGGFSTKLNASPSLPFVDIESIDGLDSVPAKVSQADREGNHGGYVSAEYETLRTVSISGTIYASPTSLDTYLDQLKADFAPSRKAKPLYFKTDAGVRVVYGRSLGLRYPKERARSIGKIAFQVQILCGDSRTYSTDKQPVAPGTFTLAGNRDTPAKFIMTAQGASVSGPRVALQNSQGSMQIRYVGGLVSGDVLIIDIDARTAILNYTTNVRNSLVFTQGRWLPCVPGVNVFAKFSDTNVGNYLPTIEVQGAWR